MTTPTPLKASPLALTSYRFTEIAVKAAPPGHDGGRFSLGTNRKLVPQANNPRLFFLELTVTIGPNADAEPTAYQAKLVVEGEFEVSDKFPAGEASDLVRITGASILYGACREMLANVTARSAHGMVTLPSVSFHDAAPPPSKAKQSTAPAKKKAKSGK